MLRIFLNILSAICSITSRPPLASNVALATTTHKIVKITSIAGLPGLTPNPKVSTNIPIPPSKPRAIPPFLAP